MSSVLKISAFIAISLDGFIARPDGSIDWLTDPDYEIPDQDFGYQTFMASVDALVMGRKTFEKVLTFDEWPYADTPVVVLSHRPLTVPDALSGQVDFMAGSPAEVVSDLNKRGFQHVYLDGGQTIQGFLRDKLVDELTITQIPILLGVGLPLFGETGHDIRLEHVYTTAYPNGFVQSTYKLGIG
jgi:dihydrofolate reductase